MADFSSETLTSTAVIESSVGVDAEVIYSVNPVAAPITPHYNLRAYRTLDISWQYWADTAVQLTNAPGGAANYSALSLVVEARIPCV